MSKTSKAEYREELDRALEDQENWGEDVDLEALSEAEQFIHTLCISQSYPQDVSHRLSTTLSYPQGYT